ncbi:pro-resilin-like [Armigeres subalbatus]|uniref:pro-resilin-like n=1 Tax=Armigeres subalbatus TaxID=124917 RepID=UPI002ED53CBE
MLRLSAVCVVLILVGVSLAEPPASGGYPDRRNGNGHGGGGGGGGGGYQQVNSGPQTYEGQNVDPQLLDMLKTLLLQQESANGGGAGGPYPSSNGGGSGGPYGSYGPPAGSSSQGRVVGIELENPKQSQQVAEFWQGGDEQSAPSGQYGAPGQGGPSGSYGAPSDSYGAPLGKK